MSLDEQILQSMDLYEDLPIGVIVVDSEFRVNAVNSWMAQLLGMPTVEGIGQPISAVHLDLDGSLRDALNEVMTSGQPQYDQEITVHLSATVGASMSLRCSHYPVKDKGETVGVRSVYRAFDLDPRDPDLRRDVGGAELRQDRLAREHSRARSKGGQTSGVLGTLTVGIAHGFNNVLASLIGYAELAKMVIPRDSEAFTYLEEIDESCHRGTTLIKELSSMWSSRGEDCGPVAVEPIVRRVVHHLVRFNGANISFRDCTAEGVLAVMADSEEIHQIVFDSCTYAWAALANKTGSVAVTLRDLEANDLTEGTSSGLKPGRYIELCATPDGDLLDRESLSRDSGPSMETERMEDPMTLILEVIREAVNSLSGSVSVGHVVDGERGLTIWLPVAPAQDQTIPLQDCSVKSVHKSSNSAQIEHVLLVDQDGEFLRVQKSNLEVQGYRVTASVDGQAALDMFCHAPREYDVLVTDLNLPKPCGLELVTKILEVQPDVPVVLLAEDGDLENVPTDVGVKTTCVASKSLLGEELTVKVRGALDECSARQERRTKKWPK